jgi:hypothetical protein
VPASSLLSYSVELFFYDRDSPGGRRPRAKHKDDSMLQMALVGYEIERQRIIQEISRVQALLGGGAAGAATDRSVPATRKKRVLSPAARKKIAEASRRRWAAYRKAKAGK